MKQISKATKIIGVSIGLVLLFLCAFNITYSYFTARAVIDGQINFGSLDVKVTYLTTDNVIYQYPEGETTVTINVLGGQTISRGSEFKMASLDGKEIRYLAFSGSGTNSYVRFWVNAYKRSGESFDKSTNYGRYFTPVVSSNVFTSSLKTVGSVTNNVYYITNAIGTAGVMGFAESMKFSADAPLELMDADVQIIITFEAVQASNKAYLSVFGDDWGYSNSWS